MGKKTRDSVVVSVTVPVYNTSKYLRQCLDSLANQTLKDIEIIIVDDGSTDESGAICDEYAKKYDNFKVIHQKNGGLAVARQIGLEEAQGEYIIVCDSDDWVELDMYEKLFNEAIATKADIVICRYFAEYENGKSIENRFLFKENNGVINNRNLIINRPGSSWIKLIKKSLFEKADADYESGINMGEDAFIIYKLMQVNPKIVQIDEALYHYRRLQGETSYTNALRMSSVYQIHHIYEWLKANPKYNTDELFMYKKIINLIFASFRAKDYDKQFISDLLSQELTWQRIFNNKLSSKSLFATFAKIIPISWSKRLLNIIYPFVYK